MYKRYYSGYEDSDLQEIIPMEKQECEKEQEEECQPSLTAFGNMNKNVLGPLAIDDILLIGVFLLLLQEDSDDKLMLIVIGFVLVAGFIS